MESYGIGELARLTGVPTGTIRFYERRGLIPAPPRTPSGYRKYSIEALARIRMVLRAKKLGFSLSEISELLDMLANRQHPCQHLHCRVANKLLELDDRISELHRIKIELQALSQTCDPRTPIGMCPVLIALAPDDNIAALLTDEPGKV
jgi:MerR family mercuric resistance operon transcriptional regulator